jgi:hypothetical protein
MRSGATTYKGQYLLTPMILGTSFFVTYHETLAYMVFFFLVSPDHFLNLLEAIMPLVVNC